MQFARSQASLDRHLHRAVAADLNYPEAHATANGAQPAGYRHDHYRKVVGRGDAVFSRAAEALRGWEVQRGAGLGVYPVEAPVTAGITVLLLAPAGPVRIVVPCRVLYLVEEERRIGFAYGTLDGHPERGEERFVVEWQDDDRVAFCVTAFSRHDDWLARLGGPVTRRLQVRTTKRYLWAMRRIMAL